MIVFESENFELEYHPEYKTLELRWIGVLESQKWEILISELIKVANMYQIESLLLDASYVDMQESMPAVQQVPLQQYFKGMRFIPTLTKIARVASGSTDYDKVVQEQYAALLISYNGIEFKSFEHYYQAMYWITGKPS
ncbi:hypothetical protein AHMF7605_29080 [Adhaeribacter arboris]|uniref:STAS/SEC14 domain-containing protein n=1 Tax=Adhaeribacter arboris TaxID=2072846 RepID=A0A2T2Y8X7_9BACT|nr:hypothetical protein [Adhaeribacter arboris]PSR51965.1 hypothetical protein AHMF7605_29080 [Adhaeribacter arboris]